MRPRHLKYFQSRSKDLTARVIDPDEKGEPYVVIVTSASNRSLNRIVTVVFGRDGTVKARCTCPWACYGGIACSHVMAALRKLAARKHRRLSFWLTGEAARRQKHHLVWLRGRKDETVWITSRPGGVSSAVLMQPSRIGARRHRSDP